MTKTYYLFTVVFYFLISPPAILGQEFNVKVTQEDEQAVVSRIVEILKEEYVFPEKGAIAADEVIENFESGHFDEANDIQSFASQLTETLAVINDKHLFVNFSPDPVRQDFVDRQPTVEEARERADLLNRRNYGFEKVERLVGNIGYLEFRDFYYDADYSEEALSAAMKFVKNTDGLIIDLRRNGGGSPDMVALFFSYIVHEKQVVDSFHYRKNNEVVDYWSLDEVNGPRYSEDKPLYILTSKNTFSAAESFTYAMQVLDRAIIVGENTGGGAHPMDFMRVHDHFLMAVPVAQGINPVTGTNWEGVGILPDHEEPSESALNTAYRLILEELISASENTARRREKEYALRQLDQQQ